MSSKLAIVPIPEALPESLDELCALREQLEMQLAAIPRKLREIQAKIEAKVHRYSFYVSPRQNQVLLGIERRLSNKEIAAEMNITERAVKYHVHQLLKKVNKPGQSREVLRLKYWLS